MTFTQYFSKISLLFIQLWLLDIFYNTVWECVFACVCVPVCAYECLNMWQGERKIDYVTQCMEAPIPISMIISYSLWAKTATLIQFISPLLTGAEILGPAEVTSEVFQCWGVAVCFTGGRTRDLAQGRWFCKPCIHDSIFASYKRFSFHAYS